MKTLTLQVTDVEFDFDDEDFTIEEQLEVISSVVGNTFEVEVDDDDDDEAIAHCLVEEVTDATLLIATLALGLKTGLAAHATVNAYQEAQAERMCQIDPSYCGLKQK